MLNQLGTNHFTGCHGVGAGGNPQRLGTKDLEMLRLCNEKAAITGLVVEKIDLTNPCFHHEL